MKTIVLNLIAKVFFGYKNFDFVEFSPVNIKIEEKDVAVSTEVDWSRPEVSLGELAFG